MGAQRRYTHYSEAEDAMILANPDASTEQLVKMLSDLGSVRDVISVRHRRNRLGVTIYKPEWTEADTQRLEALWLKDQLTAAQIHALWPEKSRSSINGKATRMGWPRTPEQRGARPPKPPKPVKAAGVFVHGRGFNPDAMPKDPRPEKCVGPTPDSLNIRMWDPRFKEGCCKFSTGEDGNGFFFCAAAAKPGLPYCGDHAAACYNGYGNRVPEAPKKDRTATAQPQEDDEPKPLDFEAAA